jgi:TolA-binding protein
MRRLLLLAPCLLALAFLSPADAQEAAKSKGGKDEELVERLLAARKEYQVTLELLRERYIKTGNIEKARWAEEELLAFHRINKNAFSLARELPPPTLKGNTNVPKANELYRRALKYKDKGWGTDYVDNQKRAELLLQKILTDYPQSDKISDTAYQLGDIYEGRTYHQYKRAAGYFERCYQWNSRTHFDARLRAARLYDRQINDRGKAAEIYREIMTHETNDARREEAQRRLQEISKR